MSNNKTPAIPTARTDSLELSPRLSGEHSSHTIEILASQSFLLGKERDAIPVSFPTSLGIGTQEFVFKLGVLEGRGVKYWHWVAGRSVGLAKAQLTSGASCSCKGTTGQLEAPW